MTIDFNRLGVMSCKQCGVTRICENGTCDDCETVKTTSHNKHYVNLHSFMGNLVHWLRQCVSLETTPTPDVPEQRVVCVVCYPEAVVAKPSQAYGVCDGCLKNLAGKSAP